MAIVGNFSFNGLVISVHDDMSYTWPTMTGGWEPSIFEIEGDRVKLIHRMGNTIKSINYIHNDSPIMERDFANSIRRIWTAYEHKLIEQHLLQNDDPYNPNKRS